MKSWSIKKKLGATSIVMALVIATLAIVAVFDMRQLSSVIDSAYDVDIVKQRLVGNIDADLREMLAKEEAAVSSALQHDADQLAVEMREFDEASARVDAAFASLKSLNENNAEHAAFTSVSEGVKSWAPVHATMMASLKAGRTDEALALQNTKVDPLVDDVDVRLSKLADEYGRTNTSSNDDADQQVARGYFLLGLCVALGVLSLAGTAWIIHTTTKQLLDITVSLANGAQNVSAASGQVSSASQILARGAGEQASSLEETSASLEEIASMTRQNAANTQQAATLVAETESVVRSANGALQEMVGSMDAIKESSDKVSKIIKTIDEIAFQTNILALNAAVEAARAGEAGMGFAVVADEVRALAQRSAQAAKDTAVLIEESIVRSADGQTKTADVSRRINSITTGTEKLKGVVDDVSEASRQQTHGLDQVTQAMSQMEKVTQSTAATAEESAAASEELSAQAEASMQAVNSLSVMVGVSVQQPVTGAARQKKTGSVAAFTPKAPKALPLTDSEVEQHTGTYGSF